MARIFSNNEWYEEMSTTALYETEFEAAVRQNADNLFPGYHFVLFKTIVSSDTDSAAPDFALIDKQYRGWWVGEVELGHHSLDHHVIPQVGTLARAAYGEAEARQLCTKCPSLELGKVVEMMKGKAPRVLVVVNVPVPQWAERLRPHDAIVAIVQIFRSFRNRHVFRLNGETPSENQEVITTCEIERYLHRFLVIHSPAALPVKNGERMLLHHQSQVTEWDRSDTASRVYLVSPRSHPLVRGEAYEIVRLDDGSYELRETQKKTKRK